MKISNPFAGTTQSSDKLRGDISALDAERVEATKRLAALKASWHDVLLLDDDSKAAAHQAADATEQRAVDRINLKLAQLATELDAAVARETNASRLAKYEEAKALRAEITKFLPKEYEKLSQRRLDLFETLAKAEIAIEAANAELPEGVDPLPGIEESVRAWPNLPRELLEEKEFDAWAVRGSGRPLPEKDQKLVHESTHQPGLFVYTTSDGQQLACEKRRYLRTTYRPAVFGRFPPHLFWAFKCPPLRQEDERNAVFAGGWEAPDHAAILARIEFERARAPAVDLATARQPVEEIRIVE